MLPPRPTPKLEDHPSSAVRGCLFNVFTATLHIGGRSSICNLRMRRAVVTGTHIQNTFRPTFRTHSSPHFRTHSDPHFRTHSDPHFRTHSDPHFRTHSDPHSEHIQTHIQNTLSVVFQVAIQKLKHQDIQNYNFGRGFVWV